MIVKGSGQERFLAAIALTNLTLHAVTVNGMLELSLRHADEQLKGRGILTRMFLFYIYSPQRVGGQHTILPASEKFADELLTDDTLLLAER